MKQIRSSAWLEHYTDNVGVSSSNLLGSTQKLIAIKLVAISPKTWGVSSAG